MTFCMNEDSTTFSFSFKLDWKLFYFLILTALNKYKTC